MVWRSAIDLSRLAYEMTARFPDSERFGLVQQMRRSAVSVASNIAEGAGRESDADKRHFFIISQGSLSELDTQLEIVRVLGFMNDGEASPLQDKIGEVGRLLSGLIRSKRGK